MEQGTRKVHRPTAFRAKFNIFPSSRRLSDHPSCPHAVSSPGRLPPAPLTSQRLATASAECSSPSSYLSVKVTCNRDLPNCPPQDHLLLEAATSILLGLTFPKRLHAYEVATFIYIYCVSPSVRKKRIKKLQHLAGFLWLPGRCQITVFCYTFLPHLVIFLLQPKLYL